MFSLQQTPGRTAIVHDMEFLFFSGYAYLGLNHEPNFLKLLHQGIDLYGAIFPSSRISNTELSLYAETEIILSNLTQTSETILFQSGFTAGKAAIEMIEAGATVFQSPFCHPAIRFNTNSNLLFSDWAKDIVKTINNQQFSATPVIISDSVNQLTAEVYDFSFLSNLQQKVICIIDDSHGMGLLGNQGEGISSQLPRNKNIEYIITYSLSKALNIQAGAVSCSNQHTAEKIRKTSWYTAVTPPSPAMLYAFSNASEIYQAQRTKLNQQKITLQKLLTDKNEIHFHPALPVFILPELLDEDYFSEKGIIISSFAYPDPKGKKINRAVINALHTNEDLQNLANAIVF